MIKFLFLLLLFSANTALGVCPATTRASYGTGEILTASALNADFNQLVTKLNAMSGECMTNATIDLTTKPTGILPQANGGTGVNDLNTVITPTAYAISNLDIDWSTAKISGGIYTKTLGSNTTFTFSNLTEGQSIVVKLLNTPSNYTVMWPTVSWPGASTPTQTIGAKVDIYSFFYHSGRVYGSVLQNFAP